jgi:hypothetical protein
MIDERCTLLASLVGRLTLAGQDELRVVDRVLEHLEHIRSGCGRHWERRLATGPCDRDGMFHLARPRPSRGVVETLCNGSWQLGDVVETQPNVRLEERCRACWRKAIGGGSLAIALLAVADDLAVELRGSEPARSEAHR